MQRPQLVIRCPICPYAASLRDDSEREAADWLGRLLTVHLKDLHPSVGDCDVRIEIFERS